MMTREYLESLGTTDEELDRRYGEFFGGTPVLVGEDTPMMQINRQHRFRQLALADQGAFDKVIGREPLGAFAENDPNTHEALRNE